MGANDLRSIGYYHPDGLRGELDLPWTTSLNGSVEVPVEDLRRGLAVLPEGSMVVLPGAVSNNEIEERQPIKTFFGDRLEIDPNTYTVVVDGSDYGFTITEFNLLSFLSSYPNRIFPRAIIMTRAWPVDYSSFDFANAERVTRTVDIHVRRVRQKLGPLSDAIRTKRGAGYGFMTECVTLLPVK